MNCKRCGNELAQGATFCGVCGTAVEPMYNNYQPAPPPQSQKSNRQTILLIAFLTITLILILAIAVGGLLILKNRSEEKNTSVSETIATTVPKAEPIPQSTPVTSIGKYLFDSDTQYITVDYLRTQSQSQVRLILNEIYARHGYIFSTAAYSSYFSQKSWYVPIYTDAAAAEALFNAIERTNKETIVKYEMSMGWR